MVFYLKRTHFSFIDHDSRITIGTPFPTASQAHALLPYEDSFVLMGGFRCPPSECNECECRRCQRSSAINKSVSDEVDGEMNSNFILGIWSWRRFVKWVLSSFRYNVADGSWTELPVTLPTFMAHPSAMYVDICHDPWWPRIGRKFDGECGNFSGFNYRTSVLRTLPFMIVKTFQKFDSNRRCEWPGSYRTNELFCSLFSLTLTFHDEIGARRSHEFSSPALTTRFFFWPPFYRCLNWTSISSHFTLNTLLKCAHKLLRQFIVSL